jgi:hypothetical protein
MLKLFCSYDSLRFILLKIWTELVSYKVLHFVSFFQFLTMFITIVGAGAGARYVTAPAPTK